jgi:hypothetical protein
LSTKQDEELLPGRSFLMYSALIIVVVGVVWWLIDQINNFIRFVFHGLMYAAAAVLIIALFKVWWKGRK